MVVPEGMPLREWEKIPVVSVLKERQLVVGSGLVPQQVPRAVSGAPPVEVTFAPRIAFVVPMLVAVGEITVGTVAVVHESRTAPFVALPPTCTGNGKAEQPKKQPP